MRRIILRPAVSDDLHGIVEYLDQNTSSDIADQFVESVFRAFDRLAEMPGIGSPKQFRTRRVEHIRSWSAPGFRNYLIFYQVHPDAILILAVIHGARDILTVLDRRD